MKYLFVVWLNIACCAFSVADSTSTLDNSLFSVNQTSASLLLKYAEREISRAQDKDAAEKRYVLLFDIYIKARSYAILNKLFFWLSVIAGIGVLLWPSLSIIWKGKLDKWEWLKSATVQTTVTGIAALTFAMYSQYKDKQTYAETLMRYVAYSDQNLSTLSVKVAEELAKIDRGFSFNSLINNDKP
jgi:nitric oxide synthase oxygenase domain/subunit